MLSAIADHTLYRLCFVAALLVFWLFSIVKTKLLQKPLTEGNEEETTAEQGIIFELTNKPDKTRQLENLQ